MPELTLEQQIEFAETVKEKSTEILRVLGDAQESTGDCAFILGICASALANILQKLSQDSLEHCRAHIQKSLLHGFDATTSIDETDLH